MWRDDTEEGEEGEKLRGGKEEGREVQKLLRNLNMFAGETNRQLVEHKELGGSKQGAAKMDSAMGNPKEGHATEVDLATGNSSKEGLKGSRRERKEARKARQKQELEKYEKYVEWKRKKDEEERHRDPEALTDPYAYEARLFEKRSTWSTGPAMAASRTTVSDCTLVLRSNTC
ncbi:hypothetical protein BAE44_0013748 [Dichanthelium oligosanthes]|uniref:Uncharacterized protein n=1 Tax=Dichanthelium oligosanthes TaxID=888268 RepID=A0A1E5VJB6_9POAL|nr:hypothetical protein BAE44_0013748 [Dichanthelium oligosanthes]